MVSIFIYSWALLFILEQIWSLQAPTATLGPGSKTCSQEKQSLHWYLPGEDMAQAMSCKAASFMQWLTVAWPFFLPVSITKNDDCWIVLEFTVKTNLVCVFSGTFCRWGLKQGVICCIVKLSVTYKRVGKSCFFFSHFVGYLLYTWWKQSIYCLAHETAVLCNISVLCSVFTLPFNVKFACG